MLLSVDSFPATDRQNNSNGWQVVEGQCVNVLNSSSAAKSMQNLKIGDLASGHRFTIGGSSPSYIVANH